MFLVLKHNAGEIDIRRQGSMSIGSKIKKSRTDAKLTQEQAAEALGISRQTLSNWENEKYYPDIASVLKMSEIYNVSLDYLLKGEGSMKNYMDYVEESTNAVASKNKFSKLLLILSYLVVWALNIAASWRFFLRTHYRSAGGRFPMARASRNNYYIIYFDRQKRLLGKAQMACANCVWRYVCTFRICSVRHKKRRYIQPA